MDDLLAAHALVGLGGIRHRVMHALQLLARQVRIARIFRAADFIDDGPVTLVLGDNLFLGQEEELNQAINTFRTGGRVFATKVPDRDAILASIKEFLSTGR